ncbi:peptidoglycan-binding domain-containing protein [Salinispora tropica]|uniref:Peptidoglycan-binding domain 1 protein n=1 Tax=Salinispora tropica (strain ATCC BAA-916 / DSM 44818 / JCM 13857 / NBRC 105044 / CNB-440) TaxID=369723 RepID=A4X2B2_SALTO|nr:peptidoglycan-binding protein [Salinispora tropica]ABP53012.1 Peptidoglycan-binding domain 1 protein [Salinispora tropica CNB-440]
MSPTSDALKWLWEEFRKVEGAARFGGIYANKRGYHNTRDANVARWPGNYSYAQFSVDREGPPGLASAIDLTFADAQAGRYETIDKYSSRLLAAGHAGRAADPRTIYMREFYGQADHDVHVEGWDYARGQAVTSDSSHLWHIHISVHRKYADDMTAMRAILSILKGETVEQWRKGQGGTPSPPPLPDQAAGSRMLRLTVPYARGTDVAAVQDAVGATRDGVFGPKTRSAVIKYQRARGLTPDGIVGPKTWATLLGSLPSHPNGSRVLRLRRPTHMRGTDVEAVQRFIGARCGAADGIFGTKTASGVRWYQRMRGLTPDGIVGPKTWAPIVRTIGR